MALDIRDYDKNVFLTINAIFYYVFSITIHAFLKYLFNYYSRPVSPHLTLVCKNFKNMYIVDLMHPENETAE